jgi:hypothetical protein
MEIIMTKPIIRILFTLCGLAALLATSLWTWRPYRNAIATSLEKPEDPVTDLVVDAMEITQSMQDMNNSVALVAGKRTFVRLYVHSTNGTSPSTAMLTASSGLLSQTVLPIAPGGPLINVRTAYNRLISSHAFLFELPKWATFLDGVTLTAEVNPDLRWRPRNPEEFSYANNTLVRTASFDPVPALHLVVASQPYTFNNTTYSASAYHRWKAAEWLSRVYPVSNVKVYFRTLPLIQAQRKQDENNNWDLIYPSCNFLNLYLASNRATIFGNPFVPKTATFLGIVPDDVGFMRGCAPINGMLTSTGYSRVASGPVGNGDWGWDFDGSYADWYSGHEVGHAWNQRHVRGGPGFVEDGCGGEASSVKQNPNGKISPTTDLLNPNAIFGFDTLRLAQGKSPILGPNWSDVMTYCDYQWMSKTTYVALKNMFTAYLPQTSSAVPNQTSAQDVLAVFGALDPSSGEVSMLPVFGFTSEEDVTPPPPGEYAIVLRAAGGAELARYPFTPYGLESGPAPHVGDEQEAAYIALLLPEMRGVASLEVEGPGGVLYQVAAGLNLPAVQITSPNGGEAFDNEDITVSWTTSDEDGDPLTYHVDYSPDNGTSWEPVAQFITETQVVLDAVNLPGSDTALFRVSASDGIHTAMDQSDGVFFIANHHPTGEILTPESGMTVASGQTVAFEGQVYDVDLGTLDGSSLQWVSDRDGVLGNGSMLSTASLSQGLHEVNLVADDGHGQTTIDQVIVIVVSTPNDLPLAPDALLAGPEIVFLYPAVGISSATIYVDNLNLGNAISWHAIASEDWLDLSSTTGQTPDEITVTTSLTPLDFGTHTAKVTFSDPDGLYPPVTLDVVVTNAEYDLFLPAVIH